MQSVANDSNIPVSASEHTRTIQNDWVPSCLPGRSVLEHPEEPERLGSRPGTRERVMHTAFETAPKQLKNVQKRQHNSKQLKYPNLARKDAKT